MFFIFWIFGFFCDVKITIKNSRYIAKHEINAVFAALYAKLGAKSCFVQFFLEASLIIAVPLFFVQSFDISASSVVALVLGTSHFLAFHSNMRFRMPV